MSTKTKSKPAAVKAVPICSCENCDWTGPESELGKTLCEIHHLWERLDEGGIVPAGECPECGCFAYLPEIADPLRDNAPAMLAALREMTNEWADPLGEIARNCGALDRTVALDGAIARARAVIKAAAGGGKAK
jgi:hypothetical protein